MKTKKQNRIVLAMLALCGAFTASAVASLVDYTAAAETETIYYSKTVEENKVFDFADTGLVTNPVTDTYAGYGRQVELWENGGLGTTVDSTFKMSFFFTSDERGYGIIAPKIAGWGEDLNVQISPDGNFKVGADRTGNYTSLPSNEVVAFSTDVIYDLDFTFVTLYDDADCTNAAGLRATARITARDGSYDKSVVKEYIPLPTGSELDYSTGGWRIWMSGELQNTFVCSTEYQPEAIVPTYYSKPVVEEKVFDFADTGLVNNAVTDTYAGYGTQIELWENGGLGTTVDSTFKMSFFFTSDERGYGIIAPKIAGWGEDLNVQISPDGNFKVGADRTGNYTSLPSNEVVAFSTDVIYDLDFTFVTLYDDADCTNAAGLRATARITARDGSYDKSVVKEYIPLPAENELNYSTGGWRIWMSGELQNAFVCSTEYDPEAQGGGDEPVPPEQPTIYYSKPVVDEKVFDFADTGLVKDPVTDTYADYGKQVEIWANGGLGTTVDSTFTMSFFFSSDDRGYGIIAPKIAGWGEDLNVQISPDGNVKVGDDRGGSDYAKLPSNEVEAFVTGTIYDVEFTFVTLYVDEACTEIAGLRATVRIIARDGSYDKSVVKEYIPLPTGSELDYSTGGWRIWMSGELKNAFVCSTEYDPEAEKIQYIPGATLETAEKIDISKKIAMNADGLKNTEFFLSNEADGYYGNYRDVYEMNKTLCFGLKGSGSIHFAISGTWIWSGYRIDFNFAASTIQMSKSSDDYGTLYNITPALSSDIIYYVELTIIEYTREDTGEHAYEEFTAKVYYLNENGEQVVIMQDTHEYNYPGQYDATNRSYFGAYMGKGDENSLEIYPVNFERNYSVTLVNGDNENSIGVSYGEAYDLTQYAPAVEGYNFEGWRYYKNGEAFLIPSAGVWMVDFTTLMVDVYVGTLTAVYTPIEYDVVYVINGGVNNEENLATINVEDGEFTLLDPTVNSEGYVFFGWYLDAEFTNRITSITCTGETITLYAKIAEGATITVVYSDGSQEMYSVEKGATFTLPAKEVVGYGEITAWEVKNGDEWNEAEAVVTVVANAVYRAVAKAIDYTITYDLDGGVNADDNPATYTINDVITFGGAEKEGYFFVGWYVDDTNVRGIVKGSTGNITVKAVFVQNSLPETLELLVSETATLLPFPVGLPAGGRYTVALFDANDAELTITAGCYTFAVAGEYRLVYSITLPAGVYTHEVAVVVNNVIIQVNGTYAETYTAGDTLTLFAGTATGYEVECKVYLNGEEVTVENNEITLKAGEYTVEYSAVDASLEKVSFTFTVTAKAASNLFDCQGTISGMPIVVLGFVALAMLKKKRDQE